MTTTINMDSGEYIWLICVIGILDFIILMNIWAAQSEIVKAIEELKNRKEDK